MSFDSKKEKVIKLLDKHFHKIFNPSHIFYTIIFIIAAIVIALFSFFPNQTAGNFALFLSAAFALTFIILMVCGLVPRFESQLFSEEKAFGRMKIIGFLMAFGLSSLIMILYFTLGASSQLLIQFLGWDIILPATFILIYFGWNLIQIFFIKTSFEVVSLRVNNKIILEDPKSKKNKTITTVFLIIALVIPIIIQIATSIGFVPYFEPQTPGDYTSLIWFIVWNVAMYIIMVITSWRLITLHLRSSKNESLNIFSSIFYVFIWLYIWYRSFSFINAFRSVTSALGIDIFQIIMDIGLMVMTAILVLRGLGNKVYRIRIFNVNNIAFFLFAFTLLYIEGQVVMITGAGSLTGTYTDRKQINMLNNFMILIITLFFYWWYSEYALERKGLILKNNYKQEEVITIIKDFKTYLVNSGALDSQRLSDSDFQRFLDKNKLSMKGKAETQELEEDYSTRPDN